MTQFFMFILEKLPKLFFQSYGIKTQKLSSPIHRAKQEVAVKPFFDLMGGGKL